MPLYDTPSAMVPNTASPWVGGIRSIAQSLAMRPYYQQLAAQRAAQAQYQNAHAGYEMAATETEREKARLTRAQADDAEAGNLGGKTLATALKKLTLNPEDTDAQGDVISEFGRAYKKNPEQTAKSLGQLFAQFQARTGGTNFNEMATLQGNAAAVAGQQTRAAQPIHVAPGGAIFDPTQNKVIFQNPSAAGAEAAYQTTTEEIPASEGKPADVTPGYKPNGLMRFFGATPTPDVTNSPAIPPTPAKKITRKVPLGLSAAVPPPTDTTPQNTGRPSATAPQVQSGGEKVRVQHPNGQYGYIPAAQVQDALSQGYKLAPK